MKILAIETATEACSAALMIDEQLLERAAIAPRQHTRLILPMVDELLKEAGIGVADLDAVAFGQGPGAFTGVRIAIGVAQGLAFAHDLPVIPVSSMATLAQQLAEEQNAVAVAIDARMHEVYWGLYQLDENRLMRSVIPERVCSPTEISKPNAGQWYGAGTGWQTYAEILTAQLNGNLTGYRGDVFPQARDLLFLAKDKFANGETLPAEQAAPVYLRDKVVN